MGYEEEWVLPVPVRTYADDDLAARLRNVLPDGATVHVDGAAAERTIRVSFHPREADAVADRLAAADGDIPRDWRREMAPPRSDTGLYEVAVGLVDHEQPLLRVYSKDAGNLEAWPLASGIGASLAAALGALAEEEAAPTERFPMFAAPVPIWVAKPN